MRVLTKVAAGLLIISFLIATAIYILSGGTARTVKHVSIADIMRKSEYVPILDSESYSYAMSSSTTSEEAKNKMVEIGLAKLQKAGVDIDAPIYKILSRNKTISGVNVIRIRSQELSADALLEGVDILIQRSDLSCSVRFFAFDQKSGKYIKATLLAFSNFIIEYNTQRLHLDDFLVMGVFVRLASDNNMSLLDAMPAAIKNKLVKRFIAVSPNSGRPASNNNKWRTSRYKIVSRYYR